MKNRRLVIAVTAASVAHPTLALAQDAETIDLAPVLVESATRFETALDETTRSVTVVTREEIEKRKLTDRSVGDILSQMVPGFSQSNKASTDYGLNLRGRKFLTLIDGIPQTSTARDGQRALNTIDPEAIERIEVVRGATAAYGFGAAGGLVNIITKKSAKGKPTIGLAQEFSLSAVHPADSLAYTTEANISGSMDSVDYLFGGAYTSRNSFFDANGDRIPPVSFGTQGGLAEGEQVNLLGKLGLNFDEDRQRVQLTANYYDQSQSPDYGNILHAGDEILMYAPPPSHDFRAPALPGNPHEHDPGTRALNLNLEYTHQDVLGSQVKSQVYYSDYEATYGKLPPYYQTRATSEKVGGRLTVTTPVEALPVPFDLVWGADYLRDDVHHFGLEDFHYSPPMVQTAYAGFAQIEVPVGEYGRISGGVRHEITDLEVSPFIYRGGTPREGGDVSYDETLFNLTGTAFLTDHIDLFGGWSEGFSLDDIGRAIGNYGIEEATGAQDKALRTQNYEVGLRANYDAWSGTVTGFLTTADNGTTYDRATLALRKSPERIWGVEAAGDIRATDRLTLGGTVTWMEGEADYNGDGTYEEDLPGDRISPLKVTAYAEYDVFDWWTTRLAGLYSGERNPNPEGSPSGTWAATADIDSYVVFDLYNSFLVGPGELEVGIENLFNADYVPALNQAYNARSFYYGAPGTTVSARYALQF